MIPTVDEVTGAVIAADHGPARHARDRDEAVWSCRLLSRLHLLESVMSIRGDCVSAFRLRAARLRFEARIIKERP